MDFSWLGGLFGAFLHLFNPLRSIKHWKIWAQIWDLYKRVKGWEDWYKKHILAQMQAWQKLQHQIFDRFVLPILKIVDLVRRITGVVGIFNRTLANQLNLMFLRVEGYLTLPLRTVTGRVNGLGGIFQAILTPLGYFDRATMLNSLWRDFGLLKSLLRNPFGATMPAGTLSPTPPFDQQVSYMTDYLQGQDSPIKTPLDQDYTELLQLLGIQGS